MILDNALWDDYVSFALGSVTLWLSQLWIDRTSAIAESPFLIIFWSSSTFSVSTIAFEFAESINFFAVSRAVHSCKEIKNKRYEQHDSWISVGELLNLKRRGNNCSLVLFSSQSCSSSLEADDVPSTSKKSMNDQSQKVPCSIHHSSPIEWFLE